MTTRKRDDDNVTSCKLEYEDGRWFSIWPDLAAYIKDWPEPDPEIVKAITAFHARYYPDEAAGNEAYPWNVHKAPNGHTRLLEALRRHELTWHWRMLLPSLKTFKTLDSNNEAAVLCVSQVRQWQLMSCFKMKWPDVPPEDLAAAVRVANKALLRPPVFGKSHRITRYEVYASLYEERTRNAIRTALEVAERDEFRRAHILGRYDTYLRVVDADLETATSGGVSYNVKLQYVIDLEPEQAPVKLEGQIATDVCRPYSLVYVPQFPETNKDYAEPKRLLFSSDNYCRAFEQVSDVLNDPSARSILLIAPPGSGKEDLSAVLHRCREHSGHAVTVSAASDDASGISHQLFFLPSSHLDLRVERRGGSIVPKSDFKADLEDGAVFNAFRGTLIIDELDKAKEDVRSMLLRFLESNDVAVPNTSIVINVTKEFRPLNVFVGSKPRKDFLQLAPVDFWSRITHIIEMQHPLAIGEPSDRFRVAEDYLRLFWLGYVMAFFDDEKLLLQVQGQNLYEPMRLLFAEWWKFFCSRSVGDFVCREIAAVLCGDGQPLPSIRTLRGTVARCLNLLFHALLFNKRGESPLELWRERAKEPASELQALFRKLHSGGDLKGPEIAALDEIRTIIRSSATIQV